MDRLGGPEAADALAILHRRYQRTISAFAHRRLRDRMAAEEAVQETFVRLWRSADRFDETRGSLDAWVFTLASRAVTDGLRRMGRTPVPGRSVEPPARHEDWDAALVVPAALRTLSRDHRAVIELAYYEGLTQPEIASHLGIALGTVKSRTYWALRSLSTALTGHEPALSSAAALSSVAA